MTAGIRRWTRRGKPNNLSNRLAAIRRHRSENLGSVEIDLLGQDRFRKMVALAVFLAHARRRHLKTLKVIQTAKFLECLCKREGKE
jgi:hypothetical protein